MDKKNSENAAHDGHCGESCSPTHGEELGTCSQPCHSVDDEIGLATCRVCQCIESDKRGDAALSLLGIAPPLQNSPKSGEEMEPNSKVIESKPYNKNGGKEFGFVEFVSPKGEVFVCNADIEMGFEDNQDMLFELGCACKNDLALVHYACALKWFVNHGSTVCEICGCVARSIRTADFDKVLSSLKEYEALRERTDNGEPNPMQLQENSGVDANTMAAIRRLRLSEITLWFGPHNNAGSSAAISQGVTEQPSNFVAEEVAPPENTATKWAVEGTGILLATGLLTVTLAWLIAPRVGKKTARSGLHILLGGVCALTVVVVFRFFVLTRIKYGPARYWAILFVFWFLVFGIWASRTHGTHPT